MRLIIRRDFLKTKVFEVSAEAIDGAGRLWQPRCRGPYKMADARERFVSLSAERRKARKKVAWWRKVTPTLMLSAASLAISLVTAGLSLSHYFMDERAQTQPYRTAFYTLRLDSFRRLSNAAAEWIDITIRETALYREALSLEPETVTKKQLAALYIHTNQFGNATTAFYRAQVLERVYWLDQDETFEKFDPVPLRMTSCAEAIATAIAIADQAKQPRFFPILLERSEAKCHFHKIAQKNDLDPYSKVVNALRQALKINEYNFAR